MIRKIVIFGGGTSGWLAAAFLSKNLNFTPSITLIEDSKTGPIGVGEGTQPATARFLSDCGIDPVQWMRPSNASFKYGVELTGWTEKPYFVDNDTFQTHVITDTCFSSHYFANKPHEEFLDWLPSYQLAKANKSPKLDGHDFNTGIPQGNYGAVHFAAFDIVNTLKDILGDSITCIDTHIVSIEKSNNGITSLVGDDGTKYTADLFIDCTGFRSILMNELGVEFQSYEQWLPCDRAVAMPTEYTDPATECFPYTKATTMNAGWRWTIPIYNRIGNGYVYSSNFISDDDAELELRHAIGEYDAKANRLKMRCGRMNEVFRDNVCAIGLSAGFVEPLEATGITFTTAVVRKLTNMLNQTAGTINRQLRGEVNQAFYEMVTEIFAFVWAHYHYSSKNDTPFWQDIRKQSYQSLPDDVKFFIDKQKNPHSAHMFMTKRSMFNTVQWFSVLHAGGECNNLNISPSDEAYAHYITETHRARIQIAKDNFPNQYHYLQRWYST